MDVNELKLNFDSDIKTVFELFLENKHNSVLTTLNEKVFLFVDEAHLDENWAKYAKLIFDRTFNVFMIFTGSSALKLNVNTDATRRITREDIYPLALKEYFYLKHNINLSSNNFKDLILRGDDNSYNKAVDYEKTIKNELNKLDNDFNIEFKNYLFYQSFPFTLDKSMESAFGKINNIVSDLIYKDLNQFKNFNKITPYIISNLVRFLALKRQGETSETRIAKSLQVSSKSVANILFALEQSQLIFDVKAYGSAGKIMKKPHEHFFLTPAFKSAINYSVGRYNIMDDDCFAVLAENLVASIIYKMSQKPMSGLALFYDGEKNGVDFIIKHVDRVIPLEVGIGKKTKRQLTIAKRRYNADYGILVSNRTRDIEFHNDNFYIPLSTFALI